MSVLVCKITIALFIAACGIIRLPFMKKRKNIRPVKTVHGGFEKAKVFVAWLGMCLVPLLYVFTPALDRFAVPLPESVRLACCAGLAANAVFFYFIHKQLDDNWSATLEIKDGQKLIDTGVYKRVRHPMYAQSWLWVVLTGAASANAFVLLFGVASWGFMYFTRVYDEEKMMLAQFGAAYEDYMKRTGRVFPKF